MNYCGECGHKINSTNFCTNCGASFKQEPKYEPQPTTSQPYKDYSTLGGWLMFFVVSTIIGCIVASIMLLYAFATTRTVYEMIGNTIWLVSFVLQIMFIYQIIQRKNMFLKYYQHASIIGVIAQLLLLIIELRGARLSASIIAVMPEIELMIVLYIVITSGAGIVLSTLYYCKSVRVRRYMGNDEYMKNALFSFKQPPL